MTPPTGQSTSTRRCGLQHYPWDPHAPLRTLVLSGGRNIGLGVHLLDARLRDDDDLARVVVSTANDEELLVSCVELVLTMAATLSGPMVQVTNEIDDPDMAATMRAMERQTHQQKLVVFLLNLALTLRNDTATHLTGCETCSESPHLCPLAVNESFVRCLADAVATQVGRPITRVDAPGMNYRHALDIAQCLAEATRVHGGTEIDEQLSTLSALPLAQLVAQQRARVNPDG